MITVKKCETTGFEPALRQVPSWFSIRDIALLAMHLLWLTNIGNVTQHSFCPRCRGSSFRQRCCRYKLTGLEQCMKIDIIKFAAYANMKTVKRYEMLVTSSLEKSTLSLEVERSFNRAVTFLFPFFDI